MAKTENPLIGPIITGPPKEIRARILHIKHRLQAYPGQNSIHLDLFDQLDLGQLKRVHEGFSSILNHGGGFLCGRNRKDLTLYYSTDGELPTCKKCRKMMATLLQRGFNIKVLSKEDWDKAVEELQQKRTDLMKEVNKKIKDEE